tara:strand:- start:906 stop:1193 length:288 start_codon:yes stop_codon:yes gene_type:complete
MEIDKATVLRISSLARIKLEEEAVDAAVDELNGIIDWVQQLNEVNTDGVQPMTSVVEVKLPEREDLVTDGVQRDELLMNAPEAEEGFFVVPKVVE